MLKNAFLDAVESTHLDINVDDSIPVDNMNAALVKLHKERLQTTVSFSFRFKSRDYESVRQMIVEVLESSAKHGVNVHIVNTIVENFGTSETIS
jgi:hypothetical protein